MCPSGGNGGGSTPPLPRVIARAMAELRADIQSVARNTVTQEGSDVNVRVTLNVDNRDQQTQDQRGSNTLEHEVRVDQGQTTENAQEQSGTNGQEQSGSNAQEQTGSNTQEQGQSGTNTQEQGQSDENTQGQEQTAEGGTGGNGGAGGSGGSGGSGGDDDDDDDDD